MSEDENALVTDHYVISPYCLQGDRTKEVYILKGHGKREWWYSLNDGLKDVGRFAPTLVRTGPSWLREDGRADFRGCVAHLC